ncbi:MAG: TonB-dependent receptor plug domain-containing protein, partial [Proteobacteria bacterium]|nr:TonB-dependent receptor plug domain-containing protein [Pseudomonadota bacterium]
MIIFIATLATSAEAQDTAEDDFFGEAPLILTASRMSKPLDESPASVSIITRKMIEASGAREIAELFRMVPGFIVGHFDGGKPLVTYQGMGRDLARQMQVLVDGRSVFIPSFGGIPWANLPLLLEDIERIEIIRGPNAVTYGANAFLATINIITRHAAEDFGARYSITASDNSNPDIKDAYLRLGFHHEDLDWRLSVGTLNDDGFADVNDSSAIDKFNFRLDYLSSNNQSWTFQLGSSDSTSGLGFPDNIENIERDADATNRYLNILWERNSAQSVSSIRLTHTEQVVTDSFLAETELEISTDFFIPITVLIDFGRISKRTDLELIQSQEFSDNFRLVYGGSLRKDQVKSIFLLNDLSFHDIDTARLFTSLEWRLDQNWLFDLGATIDRIIYKYENQPWERALCWGAKRYLPKAKLVGYQHARAPRLYLNYYLVPGEEAVAPLPDRVVTIGEHTARLLSSGGYGPGRIRVGGALHITGLDDRQPSGDESLVPANVGPVLVACSYGLEEASELADLAARLFDEDDGVSVVIKCHPAMPFRSCQQLMRGPLPKHVQVSEEPITDLIPKCSIMVYTGSMVCVQALAAGLPVIHLRPEFDLDIDPLGAV